MKVIIGFLIVIGSVIGGYIMGNGVLAALFHPNELIIIAGGAAGAFVIANPPKVIKAVFKGLPGLLKGSKYSKQDYLDLLGLMYELFSKARKEGLMALESDVEEPQQSELFKKYPKIVSDHHVLDFIADYLRLMVGGSMNAIELENLMDLELETHHHEAVAPSESVVNASDGLPGFGIVAAVMGVVITMGSLGEPPAVLGGKIGAALVGTFVGILLAYGFVGPLGKALEYRAKEEGKYLECVKVCILATLNGYTPQIAVEFGRKVIGSSERPGFLELEEFIKGKKK